jgi:hypothetical protein
VPNSLLGGSSIALAGNDDFPYELQTGRELLLLGLGAGLASGGLILQSNQSPLQQEDLADLSSSDINCLDRGATDNWSPSADQASDILVGCLVASPVVLAATGRGARDPVTILVMYAETMLLANGVTQMTKGLVQRNRPYVYNDDPDIPESQKLEVDARRSFPSSHATNAFASAVFLSTVYGRLYPESNARGWVWAGSVGTAGTIAWLRCRAGQHFPTDVLIGSAIGTLVGYFVPWLHEREGVSMGLGSVGSQPAISLTVRF